MTKTGVFSFEWHVDRMSTRDVHIVRPLLDFGLEVVFVCYTR